MNKEFKDLELNNEYLVRLINNAFIEFNGIERIKILKKTKKCTLIAVFNERKKILVNYSWKNNRDEVEFIEDLKIDVRQKKLNENN
jgi:hypothetical protein